MKINIDDYMWLIKHKEMNPKLVGKNYNYWGDNKPYKTIRDIRMDLGDRFEYAKKIY